MKEIKRLFEEFIAPILINQDGINFILENDFDALNLNINDKKKILLYLENLNIGIVGNNFLFLEKETIEDTKDFSEYTIVEYDNLGNITNLDFSKLDDYLENLFIPGNVKVVKLKDENNKFIYYETIRLSRILRKEFNEIEIDHIFNYLKESRILVSGFDSKYEKRYDNYHLIRSTKSNLGKSIYNVEYQNELFDEYKLSNSIEIRNKIVLTNLRLVESISYKYASLFNIDVCEINSYGYEGLIMAIDAYNKDLGFKFSTFAMTYIINKILSSIPLFFDMKKGSFFENFLKAKINIEKEYDCKLEDNLDLVENILNYMLKMGCISIKHYNDYRDKILMAFPSYLDNLERDEFLTEENKLERIENELFLINLEKVFNILSSEEVLIIKATYGFLDGKCLTSNEIEEKFNIENVYNKRRTIMRKIRKSIITKGNNFIIPSKYNLEDKFDDKSLLYICKTKKI